MNNTRDNPVPEDTLRAITERLLEEGTKARANFQIWSLLCEDEALDHPEFGSYFYTSKVGAFSLFMLALSKMFDTDERSAGFKELRRVLKEAGWHDLEANLGAQLDPMHDVVQAFMGIRSKSLVHNSTFIARDDVYERAGLLVEDLRMLVDTACCCIEQVAQRLQIPNRGMMTNRVQTSLGSLLAQIR